MKTLHLLSYTHSIDNEATPRSPIHHSMLHDKDPASIALPSFTKINHTKPLSPIPYSHTIQTCKYVTPPSCCVPNLRLKNLEFHLESKAVKGECEGQDQKHKYLIRTAGGEETASAPLWFLRLKSILKTGLCERGNLSTLQSTTGGEKTDSATPDWE
jgi:hypothetical protein